MGGIYVRKIEKVTARQNGANVIVVMENRRSLDMPWDAALALAKAIYVQARRAEEHAKALTIVQDQALLIRSRAPFGLTNNPDIIAEAKKEAVCNPTLRKFVPPKNIGGPILGTPKVIRHRKKRVS